MEKEMSGIIELDNGFKFVWMISYTEVHGHIRKPDGQVMAGTSGWYRTAFPQKAAERASNHLAPRRNSE